VTIPPDTVNLPDSPPHVSMLTLTAGMLVIFAVLRLLLFVVFPIFLTNDSPDYIIGSDGIYRSLDFNNAGLSTWRSPLYPIVLALSRPLTQMRSDRMIELQTYMGLSAILLAATLGYLLNSRTVGIVLAIFFGINPVYLLYEHAVMTETLFTLAVMCVTVVALVCLKRRLTFVNGAALGIATSACVLIRSNGIAYGVALILVVAAVKVLQPRLQQQPSGPGELNRGALKFLAGAGMCVGLILGLWVWRNYTAFGIVSLSASTNELVVFCLTEEGLLDLSLPITHAFNRIYDPANPDTIWAFTWQMRVVEPSKMEPLASAIIREQILHNPAGYGRAVLNSAVNFGGYPVPNVPGPATDLVWWFGHDVSKVDELDARNKAFVPSLASTGFSYSGRAGSTVLTSAWALSGLTYLEVFRPALSVVFAVACILFISVRKLRGANLTSAFAWNCLCGYFATLGLHALTLSAYDRYATPFDWIEVLIVTVVVSNIITAIRSKPLASMPGRQTDKITGRTARNLCHAP
jgi:hypothetical protein